MRAAALLAALAASAAPARAQSAYEIQVYGSETVPRGETMAELHTNMAPSGPLDAAGETQPDLHAFHETFELTRGFTDWFETGFYAFTSARSGEGWRWAGTHLRPRVAAPKSWGWPVGASLSVEGGYFEPRFADAVWDLEIRPIVDWRRGRFYASLNPALEKTLVPRRDGSTSLAFAPAAKVSWDASRLLTVGLEYYGDLGAVQKFPREVGQQHQLFPVVDLNFSDAWEFDAGAGFGLSRAADRLVLKLILGRRLP